MRVLRIFLEFLFIVTCVDMGYGFFNMVPTNTQGYLQMKPNKEERKGHCEFDKYDLDDERIEIRNIPSITARVPTASLADSLGSLSPETMKKLGIDPEKWIKFSVAVKDAAEKAPMAAHPILKPVLNQMVSGLGLKNTHRDPEAIIESVNKASYKIIIATNKRFNHLKEYVDQTGRKLLKHNMENHYLGQQENWANCLLRKSLWDSNKCQKDVEQDVNGLKNFFVNKRMYTLYPRKKMSVEDIKFLETQLPVTRTWAVFHLQIIAVLLRTLEKMKKDPKRAHKKKYYRNQYTLYKDKLRTNGQFYMGYMEWALKKIRKARIVENQFDEEPQCTKFEDEFDGRTYGQCLQYSQKKCTFKPTKFSHKFCDLDITMSCSDCVCKVCTGVFGICRTDTWITKSLHTNVFSHIKDRMDEISQKYIEDLKPRFNAYWSREVGRHISVLKDIFNSPKLNLDEGKSGSRDAIEDNEDDFGDGLFDDVNEQSGSGEEEIGEEAKGNEDIGDNVISETRGKTDADKFKNVPEEVKERIREMAKMEKESEEQDDEILQGVTGKETFTEYLRKVDQNVKTRYKNKNQIQKQYRLISHFTIFNKNFSQNTFNTNFNLH
uniref:Uncharacterized protein n=1 Tax=Clytia hemisphaerica TaxID=252671 RepID=A0A7M5WL93_9CNID